MNKYIRPDNFFNKHKVLKDNLHFLLEDNNIFGNTFNKWRIKKCEKLIKHFGIKWFYKKKILEIGCGFGNVGLFFKSLGAEVHFNDARVENLNEVIKKEPKAKIYCFDCEKAKPLAEHYDLIIDFGVLYNLNYWEKHLINLLNSCDYLCLDTAVNKYKNDTEFKIINFSYSNPQHGPFNNIGTLTSAYNIENVFKNKSIKFIRYDDKQLNDDLIYDWQEEKYTYFTNGINTIHHWRFAPHYKGHRFWITTKND